MVWDTRLPTGPNFQWHNHTVRDPAPKQAAADHDPEKVLPAVAGQTGFTFKKDRRKVTVLTVSVPEKK